MSALIGFLGGVGDAGVKMGLSHLKSLDDRENEERSIAQRASAEESNIRLRADLDTLKEERIAKLRAAPYKRLGELATAAAGEKVPTDIKPVDAVKGYDPMAAEDGPPREGFKGNIVEIRKGIEDIKDPKDRAAALAQLERQIANDDAANRALIGPERSRTPDEALREAANRAKITDPEAAAVYEEKFGRPAREERRLDQVDTREANRDKRDEARIANDELRLAQQGKRIELQDAYQQRREERLDRLAELQEQRAAGNQEKAEKQSQRTAVVELMKSTERELERTMALAKDPTLTPEMQKMFEGRTTALTRDLGRYRKAVESFGGDSMPKADDSPAPKATAPAAAIEALRKDPKLRDQFIAKYGADALPADGAKTDRAEPKPATERPSATKKTTDPMQAQFDAETRDIENGRRSGYSAEVQKWIDDDNARKDAAAKAGGEQFKADELRRAQANSRALIGVR